MRQIGWMVVFLGLVLARAVSPRTSFTPPEHMQLGGHDVCVWRPAASRRAVPLVIFSHGFHGNANQSTYLMEALAKAGYLVLAPNHQDALAPGVWPSSMRPDARFGRPDTWTDQVYRDRAQDLQDVWRAALATPHLHVDPARVSLAGHSLGGYCVLGLAGAWPSWTSDLKPRAVLALSPYCQPFLVHRTLRALDAPVMYQGGTQDFAITPALGGPRGAYVQSPDPKVFVEFAGAGHFSFSNLRTDQQDIIARYAVAFLNHHVQGAAVDSILTTPVEGVQTLKSSEKETRSPGAPNRP